MLVRPRAVVALALVSACAPTTYDASIATTVAPTTSTTVPITTVDDALAAMLAEVETLGRKVEAGKGDQEAATLIEDLWAVARDEIAAARPELLADFEFVVSRCRLAADRNRPADADRAFKNLLVLVDAFGT